MSKNLTPQTLSNNQQQPLRQYTGGVNFNRLFGPLSSHPSPSLQPPPHLIPTSKLVALIPIENKPAPVLGVPIYDFAPHPDRPVKLFSQVGSISEIYSSTWNQLVSLQTGEPSNPQPRGLFTCGERCLLVCHSLLRYVDTSPRRLIFPVATPKDSKSKHQPQVIVKSHSLYREPDNLSSILVHANNEPLDLNTPKTENRFYSEAVSEVKSGQKIIFDSGNFMKKFGPLKHTFGFRKEGFDYLKKLLSEPDPEPTTSRRSLGSNGVVQSGFYPYYLNEMVMGPQEKLCGNCGIVNPISRESCDRCTRPLKVLNELQPHPNKRNSDCIELESDEEGMPPNKRSKTPIETNNNEDCNSASNMNGGGGPSIPLKNRAAYNELVSHFREIAANAQCPEPFTTLQCRLAYASIRIGPVKFIAQTLGNKREPMIAIISKQGVYFQVPSMNKPSEMVDCVIPRDSILEFGGHLKARLPVLIITTGPSYISFISRELGIQPSSDINKSHIIIFLFEPPNDMEVAIIKKTFSTVYIDVEFAKVNTLLLEKANDTNFDVVRMKEPSQANSRLRSRSKALPPPIDVANINNTEKSLATIPHLNITFNTRDILCLNESNYLNDNSMDFWLDHLYENVLTPEQREKSFIFHTYFYLALNSKTSVSNGRNSTTGSTPKTPAESRHAKVAKMTKDVDIFSKDFLFVPICEGFHWFLAIICFPWMDIPQNSETGEEIPEFLNLSAKERAASKIKVKQPTIVILDSLGGESRLKIFTILREYLAEEHKARIKTERVIDKKLFKGVIPKVPQQQNATDCGLFLLEYVRYFFLDPFKNFKYPMDEKRKWFNPEAVSNLRREIYDVLTARLIKENPACKDDIPTVNFPERWIPPEPKPPGEKKPKIPKKLKKESEDSNSMDVSNEVTPPDQKGTSKQAKPRKKSPTAAPKNSDPTPKTSKTPKSMRKINPPYAASAESTPPNDSQTFPRLPPKMRGKSLAKGTPSPPAPPPERSPSPSLLTNSSQESALAETEEDEDEKEELMDI